MLKNYLEWITRERLQKEGLGNSSTNSFTPHMLQEFIDEFFIDKTDVQQYLQLMKRFNIGEPKKLDAWDRLVLTYDGIGYSSPRIGVIHEQLLLYMIYNGILNVPVLTIKFWYEKPESLKDFICLQMPKVNNGAILFSESYVIETISKPDGTMKTQEFFGDLTEQSSIFIHYKDLIKRKFNLELLLKQYRAGK